MFFLRIKKHLLSILGKVSKNGRLSFWVSYVHNRHKLPDFKHPKDLSEIWIKRVLDGKVNDIYWLADKYAVRKYVEEKGMKNILTPLLGVYTNPEEIVFNSLPNRFALKANFGAGYNIICTDKKQFNVNKSMSEMKEWMMPKTYSKSERHYNLIDKRIICEEFIDDGSGGFPVDYKFMCLKGKVYCVLGVSGRENGKDSYLPYSPNWETRPDYYRGTATAVVPLPRPANLEEMIRVAEKLAEGIDLVRVDLYSNGSHIWFGEMTLTPAGCIFHRWTQKALDDMGETYRKMEP